MSKVKLLNFIGIFLLTTGLIFGIPPQQKAHAEVPTEALNRVIENYIVSNNGSISYEDVAYIAKAILYYSYNYKVDPLVVTALIKSESNFNANAYSSAGAIGLGQLMPRTAEALGVNPYDPAQNIEGACSYLATQINNFSGWAYPVEFALAAYNAGPNAVREYGGIPPYAETQNYVSKIRSEYYGLYNNLKNVLSA